MLRAQKYQKPQKRVESSTLLCPVPTPVSQLNRRRAAQKEELSSLRRSGRLSAEYLQEMAASSERKGFDGDSDPPPLSKKDGGGAILLASTVVT